MRDLREILICTDCALYHANGDMTGNPHCETEAGQDEWLADVERCTKGGRVIVGETSHDFSSIWCQTCGSRLGGERHDAWFDVLEAAE